MPASISRVRHTILSVPCRRRRAGRGPSSVPAPADAIPGDVARQPLGVDARHQPVTFSRRTWGTAGRLRRRREELLETLVARFAAILVDRHGSSVPASSKSTLACERLGMSPDADLEGVPSSPRLPLGPRGRIPPDFLDRESSPASRSTGARAVAAGGSGAARSDRRLRYERLHHRARRRGARRGGLRRRAAPRRPGRSRT